MESIKKLLRELENHPTHDKKLYSKNKYKDFRRHKYTEEDNYDEDIRYKRKDKHYPIWEKDAEEVNEYEEEYDSDNFTDRICEKLETLKEEHPEVFCILKVELFKLLHGPHFTKDLVEEALEAVTAKYGHRNKIKWTVEESEQIANKFGIHYELNNKYDWYYAINLMYLLYSEVLPDDLQTYVKLAYCWINDKSLPEGKPFIHYHHHIKYSK